MPSEVHAEVERILRDTAAAVVMPHFAALLPYQTEMKSANEPVTIADREAELMIEAALRDLLPGSPVVGEEGCAANPRLLDELGDGQVWIVDPIDGTANFAATRAPFTMMIALMRDGKLVGSWIYDPLGDHLGVAELGGGAWFDGERIIAGGSPRNPERWHGIVSRAFLPPGGEAFADGLATIAGRVDPTARCAGYEYPLVARGARDFALYWRTLVWDHAPGVLLVTEAGGAAVYLDGAPYDPLVARSGLLVVHDQAATQILLGCPRPSLVLD